VKTGWRYKICQEQEYLAIHKKMLTTIFTTSMFYNKSKQWFYTRQLTRALKPHKNIKWHSLEIEPVKISILGQCKMDSLEFQGSHFLSIETIDEDTSIWSDLVWQSKKAHSNGMFLVPKGKCVYSYARLNHDTYHHITYHGKQESTYTTDFSLLFLNECLPIHKKPLFYRVNHYLFNENDIVYMVKDENMIPFSSMLFATCKDIVMYQSQYYSGLPFHYHGWTLVLILFVCVFMDWIAYRTASRFKNYIKQAHYKH
jgi:hypothetical protein